MKRNNQTIQESAANLAEDAQALLAATADVAGDKVTEARKRLSAALVRGKERGKVIWGQVQDSAASRAKAADEVIHEHPYKSIGIAFGVGALLGLLLRRRSS